MQYSQNNQNYHPLISSSSIKNKIFHTQDKIKIKTLIHYKLLILNIIKQI